MSEIKVKAGKYKPAYPGETIVAENRRKYLDPGYELKKLRSISDEDVVRLLGHRVPGEAYKSVHPPLEELGEPACPIRELVEPTPGAKAGDRIRYIQFTDSVYFAPLAPYVRSWIPARVGVRGATVHGHSLRLDENGMMFDALRRYTFDKATGEVVYVKDQVGVPLETPVRVGKPLPEEELKKMTTIYRVDGVSTRDDPELLNWVKRIHLLRTLAGFKLEKAEKV
ncbi:MAG: methyl-coenzyme reductase gamma subunit [Archaeoglobaceae archaeon]|nr:methyl-coenzyme reductase gamma subunit [Archaeoglobaceae archaeon]